MALDLMSLIQSAGLGLDPEPEDVVVTAEPKRTIPEDTRMEPGPRKTDELIQRKGMFGLKGTLRDVLGLVGDSLLVGGGKNAIYRPVREQEKLGSAIYGYNDDPEAAIARAAIVNPEAAMDLQKQYTQDKRADQYVSAQKITGQQKASGTLASWARSLTPETYALARPKLQQYANQYELGYDFPETYDKDYMAQVFTRGLGADDIADNDRADADSGSRRAYQEAQIAAGEARVGEQRRHNQATEQIARNRPRPAARVDHGPGLSNVDASVAEAVLSGRATPAQMRYYEQRIRRPEPKAGGSLLSRLKGGSGGPPPPPNGGSFRKVN